MLVETDNSERLVTAIPPERIAAFVKLLGAAYAVRKPQRSTHVGITPVIPRGHQDRALEAAATQVVVNTAHADSGERVPGKRIAAPTGR